MCILSGCIFRPFGILPVRIELNFERIQVNFEKKTTTIKRLIFVYLRNRWQFATLNCEPRTCFEIRIFNLKKYDESDFKDKNC